MNAKELDALVYLFTMEVAIGRWFYPTESVMGIGNDELSATLEELKKRKMVEIVDNSFPQKYIRVK